MKARLDGSVPFEVPHLELLHASLAAYNQCIAFEGAGIS
jgi:hypothetical protein